MAPSTDPVVLTAAGAALVDTEGAEGAEELAEDDGRRVAVGAVVAGRAADEEVEVGTADEVDVLDVDVEVGTAEEDEDVLGLVLPPPTGLPLASRYQFPDGSPRHSPTVTSW